MPYSDLIKQKEAQHRSYLNNKERYIKKQRDTRTIWRQRINELKSKPCMDCGGKFPPCVMDFDHRDRNTKIAGVCELSRHSTWVAVIKEIEKCDVVCANCHRIRTQKQHVEIANGPVAQRLAADAF